MILKIQDFISCTSIEVIDWFDALTKYTSDLLPVKGRTCDSMKSEVYGCKEDGT